MPKLTQNPPAHEAEPNAVIGSTKIAHWSRMAVFASALSVTPACTPTATPTFTFSPQPTQQPAVAQTPQPVMQPAPVSTVQTPSAQPKTIQNNETVSEHAETILAKVINDPKNLTEVSPELKNDRDFIRSGLERTVAPDILIQLAPQWVRQDKEMLLTALKRNWALIQFADDALKTDRDFMLQAIQIDGRVICDAGENLSKDRALALAAVSQNGLALVTLENFRDDRRIVLKAIRQNPSAFNFAGQALLADGNLLLFALRQPISHDFVSPLQFADWKLQRNRMIVLTAIKQDPRALEYADDTLKEDKQVVLAAVRQDGRTLAFADRRLQLDPDLVQAALDQCQCEVSELGLRIRDIRYDKNGKIVDVLPVIEADPGEPPKLDLGRLAD